MTSLLLAELPRQALALAAERAGAKCVDHTLTPRLVADAAQATVESEWVAVTTLKVQLKRGTAPQGHLELPMARGKGDSIPFERITAAFAPLIDKGVFADAIAIVEKPRPMGDLPAPEGVETMLGRVNFFDAFRAARQTHAALLADGESPARLSALARAYANLGESTRPLLSAHFDVFFARALLYAERLVAARPNDSLSYWTRAYVRAVIGLPSASEDAAKASSMGSATPAWAVPIIAMNDGDSAKAYATIPASEKAGYGGLAAHCAMRTVEHGGLDSVAIRFAEVALAKDPTDLQAWLVANDNSGVGNMHVTTEAMPAAMQRGYAAIAGWEEVPAGVKTAIAGANAHRFDAQSQLAMWAALDAEPADANLLPWSTLAELARETSVLLADRRLNFVTERWGVDGTDELKAWWPLVKDHPAAGLIDSYVHPADPAALAKFDPARHHLSAMPFISHFGKSRSAIAPTWERVAEIAPGNMDMTTFDLEEYLWTYHRDILGTPNLAAMDAARRLIATAPKNTVGVAGMILYDWPSMSSRKEELKALAANAPHVAWRLGQRLVVDGQPDRAIAVLNSITRIAPSAAVYETLANAYRAMGDVNAMVQALEAYVKTGEDFGLDHSKALSTVAQELLGLGDAQRALPYAQESAQSGASWAMDVYAENLARVGKFREAAAVYAEQVERYPSADRYRAFLLGTLYPEMADAQANAWAQSQLAAWSQPTASDGNKRRAACMLIADGKLDEAQRVMEQQRGSDGLIGLTTLASVDLLLDDLQKAMGVLDRIDIAKPDGDPNFEPHKAAAKIVRAILGGKPPALPSPASAVLNNSASDNSKATAAALVGLACERTGHKSEAEAWYRRALRCTGIGPGRTIAATRLRQAGMKLWP